MLVVVGARAAHSALAFGMSESDPIVQVESEAEPDSADPGPSKAARVLGVAFVVGAMALFATDSHEELAAALFGLTCLLSAAASVAWFRSAVRRKEGRGPTLFWAVVSLVVCVLCLLAAVFWAMIASFSMGGGAFG